MEDAIALDRALATHNDDVAAALPLSRPAPADRRKDRQGRERQCFLYEHFAEHMELGPSNSP